MVSINLVNPYYLLFLPATSGASRIPGLRASVNRKINGGNPPLRSVSNSRGRPGAQTGSPNKTPENWDSSSEFGSFGT